MRVLYLTPLSHFSRKVRIVLSELGLECSLRYVPNLLSSNPADFGGNPILRVPVLEDGGGWLVESDQIVRYLIDTYDSKPDRFAFFSMNAAQRNALSIISAIMGAEVELILSRRAGLGAGVGRAYFDRYLDVIDHSLSWLEERGPALWPSVDFCYLDIALVCMWDHLHFNRLVDVPLDRPWIAERAGRFAARPSVASTSPERMQELQWQLYPDQRPPNAAP